MRWVTYAWDHPFMNSPTCTIGRYRWLWRARFEAWWFNLITIDGHAWVELVAPTNAAGQTAMGGPYR